MADAIIRPAPKRRRRWPRILGRIFLALIILLVVVYFVGTSSAVFKGVILPKVGKAMNASSNRSVAVTFNFATSSGDTSNGAPPKAIAG